MPLSYTLCLTANGLLAGFMLHSHTVTNRIISSVFQTDSSTAIPTAKDGKAADSDPPKPTIIAAAPKPSASSASGPSFDRMSGGGYTEFEWWLAYRHFTSSVGRSDA